MIAYKYVVHSDVDENNVYNEFEIADDAIEYAKQFPETDKVWIDQVVVDINDDGEVTEVYENETEKIWDYNNLYEECDPLDSFCIDDLDDESKPADVEEGLMVAVKEVPDEEFDGIDWADVDLADVDSCEADTYCADGSCDHPLDDDEWPEPTKDISIVAEPAADVNGFVDDFDVDFQSVEEKEPLTEEDEVKEDEVPDDFEGQMDFLADSEEKAISEYEAVIDKVEDEHVAGELEKIATEEEAHKDFVNAVKEDPTAEYVEPLETEEESEEASEDEEEIFEDEVDFEECLKESFNSDELNKLFDLSAKLGLETIGDIDQYMKDNHLSEKELLSYMEQDAEKLENSVTETLTEGLFDGVKLDKLVSDLSGTDHGYVVKVYKSDNTLDDENNKKYQQEFKKLAQAEKLAAPLSKKFKDGKVRILVHDVNHKILGGDNEYFTAKSYVNGTVDKDGVSSILTKNAQINNAAKKAADEEKAAEKKAAAEKAAAEEAARKKAAEEEAARIAKEKEDKKLDKKIDKANKKAYTEPTPEQEKEEEKVEKDKKEKDLSIEADPSQKQEKPEDKEVSSGDQQKAETETGDANSSTDTTATNTTDTTVKTPNKGDKLAAERARNTKIKQALADAGIDTSTLDKDEFRKLKVSLKGAFSEGLDYNLMQEALEENEDEVECRGCYELFPKSSCVKTKHGYYCEACADSLREELTEHINDRPADIESDQEYQGVDNAVVDCETYTVVAHSEDEKPLDCKMEKPALEEPLAGDEVDVKVIK